MLDSCALRGEHMKIVTILLALLTQPAFASIPNSKLEPRHQGIISDAIIKKCFYFSEIEEVSSQSKEIWIDQGIRDVDYESIYHVRVWVDQGLFDEYRVTVKSHFGDFYDHESRNWGFYSVSHVKCDLL